jgi:hypothetical protein
MIIGDDGRDEVGSGEAIQTVMRSDPVGLGPVLG